MKIGFCHYYVRRPLISYTLIEFKENIESTHNRLNITWHQYKATIERRLKMLTDHHFHARLSEYLFNENVWNVCILSVDTDIFSSWSHGTEWASKRYITYTSALTPCSTHTCIMNPGRLKATLCEEQVYHNCIYIVKLNIWWADNLRVKNDHIMMRVCPIND